MQLICVAILHLHCWHNMYCCTSCKHCPDIELCHTLQLPTQPAKHFCFCKFTYVLCLSWKILLFTWQIWPLRTSSGMSLASWLRTLATATSDQPSTCLTLAGGSPLMAMTWVPTQQGSWTGNPSPLPSSHLPALPSPPLTSPPSPPLLSPPRPPLPSSHLLSPPLPCHPLRTAACPMGDGSAL